jgi:hypothetical protein
MIYPTSGNTSLPHQDMPEDVKRDYEEARCIVGLSPRSSAALLRLSMQKLTINILKAGPDSSLNDNIEKLVGNGLPQTLQQAFDIVRITGNNAVHPGVIDLRDDVKTASKLFELVNLVVDYLIAKPKEIAGMYNDLPKDELKRIDRRDGK